MNQYHKINTVFKRTPDGKKILMWDYSQPEFEYLATNDWVFTEKVDGTNIRVMYDGISLTFGGKTNNAQIPAKLFEYLNSTFTKNLMNEVFPPVWEEGTECWPQVCLYGEGYGLKIQKGGGNYIPNGVSFVLFDIKIGDWWLQRENVEDVALKLGIETVPIIGEGTLYDLVNLCRAGFTSQWGPFTAEGIVARPKVELKTRSGSRIITKLKYKDFNDEV
jgi:hypothetical protein